MKGLRERLDDGVVLAAEGYLFELERRGYLRSGPYVPEVVLDFARIWRAADKVVFSTTLDAVTTRRTRLERSFDPVTVADLVASSARDVSVGGPGLAAAARSGPAPA